jgi:hypothetical protein
MVVASLPEVEEVREEKLEAKESAPSVFVLSPQAPRHRTQWYWQSQRAECQVTPCPVLLLCHLVEELAELVPNTTRICCPEDLIEPEDDLKEEEDFLVDDEALVDDDALVYEPIVAEALEGSKSSPSDLLPESPSAPTISISSSEVTLT